jgi:hypothetical protein
LISSRTGSLGHRVILTEAATDYVPLLSDFQVTARADRGRLRSVTTPPSRGSAAGRAGYGVPVTDAALADRPGKGQVIVDA